MGDEMSDDEVERLIDGLGGDPFPDVDSKILVNTVACGAGVSFVLGWLHKILGKDCGC